MVHVNDQTVNDEATIPFGGHGRVRQRRAGSAARRTGTSSPSGSGSRCATTPVLPVPVLSRDDGGIDHRGRAGSPASRRRPRRASSRRPTTRSAPRPASACSRPPGRSTTSPTPSPAACSRAGSRSSASSSTTSPTRTSPRSSAASRTPPRPPATSSSPAARSATPSASARTSGCCARCARRPSCSRAAASTTRRSTRRWTGTSPRCAPTARRSSTSRRTRCGEPEVGVDNAAGIAAMVAALVGLGPPADRVPRRPAVAVRRPGAAGRATGRGLDDGGHRVRRAAGRADELRPRGRRARRRHAARRRTRRSRRSACANDLLALGALAAAGRARDRRARATVSVAGFDDISTAALTAPGLSTVRLPLRELGRRGFEHAGRRPGGRSTPRREVPADRGRPARLDRAGRPSRCRTRVADRGRA